MHDVLNLVGGPGYQSNNPNSLFTSNDAVPFRFTPNMQHLLGPIFTEGILAAGIMSIGRCLTEPEVSQPERLRSPLLIVY